MTYTCRNALKTVTISVTLAVLAGCATQPITETTAQTDPKSETADPRITQQLSAVEALILQQQTEEAQIILNGVNFQQLTIGQKTRYALARTDIALTEGQGQTALIWLGGEYAHLFDGLPLEQQINISLKRAQAYELTGEMLASARERIFLDPVLPEDQQQINQDQIWYSLALVPESELELLVENESSPDLTGWAELSLISRNQTDDLYRLIAFVDRWQVENPAHPAAQNLPGSLSILREIAGTQPRSIGVLLPLSGSLEKAGKAIRDGLLAGWHQTDRQGQQTPTLRFYDTNTTEDVQSLYQQAVYNGAEVVIGPLAKSRVQILKDSGELDVPLLALNYAEQGNTSMPNFYQFGLAPEDEVKQIAEDVWQQGVRNVMVIAPNSNWGIRVSDTFIRDWQLKGGTIASKALFTQPDQYLNSLKQALNVNASEQRHQRLQRKFGEKLEFEFRRRQDVDLIFLLAFPAQARQLKPLLTYQRAGDIPIVATSNIYSGQSDPDKDADLNGIRFVEMPWRLKPSPLKIDVNDAFPDSLTNYASLVALGVDAYRLYPRLPQMAAFSGVRIQGETGLLSMNSAGQIERILDWAVVENGFVQAMTANQSPE